MQAHDVAIHLIREWATDKNRDLTEADIKNLNKIILVRPYWKEALTYDGQPTRKQIKVGDYKDYPNSVRLKSGEMFHYASPQETPQLMQELIDWYRKTEIQHPLYLAAELHYKFIRIHPFDDGNGRIARLLINYVLMKNGYTPIIIKSADKENYITALQKADSGDKAAFPDYMAQQLIWSLELEEKAAQDKDLEEPDDIDKEISLLKKGLKYESKLTQKATVDAISEIIEENIIPLFKVLEKRSDDLKDLFFDYDRKINYKVIGEQTDYLLGSKDSSWDALTKNWLDGRIRQQQKRVLEIRYNYELKGLKKTIDGKHMWLGVDVLFGDYNYSIKTPDKNEPKVFPYGKQITEDDLQNLIKPMLRDIIKRIKNTK